MRIAAILSLLVGIASLMLSMADPARAAAPFTFTAAGDHGVGTRTNLSIDVVKNSGSSFYLALGDLSYTQGGEQSWCSTFKSQFNDVEVLAGNHDVGESSGGDINRYIQYCPFTLHTLVGDYGKQYYFDYPQTDPLARFIMIAPGVHGSLNINYNAGGAGYVFTDNAITSARAAGIKWIVVGMHKNCISMGQKTCEVGTDIMNLLLNHKVDLILQSHDHNYQRSHQLRCLTPNVYNANCVSDNGADGQYVKGGGSVIVINGEFGRSLYDVNSSDLEASYFATADDTTWGVTKYTVGDTDLSAQYLRSDGLSFADSFTIREGVLPTPTATPVHTGAHVADLDRTSRSQRNTWTATVTISVHGPDHEPVAGATVSGSWSGGYVGNGSCTTGSDGTCSVVRDSIAKKNASVNWTVNSIAHDSLAYQPEVNHDPDGESNGTTIMVAKP